MKPGLYPDVPEGEYHADPAVSQSMLKTFMRAPAAYRHALDNPAPSTAAMTVGSAVHRLILGQPIERPRYVVDAPAWRTKASKRARHVAETFGFEAVLAGKADEQGELHQVRAMAEAVLAHPEARAMLERPGYSELSMWWVDPDSGLHCRGRLDRLNDLEPLDVKTTLDAGRRAFARSCVTYGYDVQAAYYGMGLAALGTDMPPMRFIAVEKHAPHLVAVHALDPDWVADATDRARQSLRELAHCQAADEWPGYPSNPDPLTHPYRSL